MTDIIAFPPAAIVSWTPGEERATMRSIYARSGKRAVSGIGAARRVVDMTISALSRDRAGAGYLAELWRYADGGVGLVRLTLPPQNWHLDWLDLRARIGNSVTGAGPVFANTVRLATPVTLPGYPAAVEVTGLPPGIIVARPGDVLRIYDPADGADLGAARVLDLTRADMSGEAIVPLDVALPAGVAAFADEESAVFEITNYSPGAQGIGSNWQISLSLREVLAAEIDSPTEVNPWRA